MLRLPRVTLRPLLAADLPRVLPWFDDAETRRWLGDRRWPAMALDLAAGDDRRHAFLVFHERVPVGLVDVEQYRDRRASFANVTAPDFRREGLGAAAIGRLLAMIRARGIVEAFAGVEDGNVASKRLLKRRGFVQRTEADEEGFRYFARARAGHPPVLPWRRPAD